MCSTRHKDVGLRPTTDEGTFASTSTKEDTFPPFILGISRGY